MAISSVTSLKGFYPDTHIKTTTIVGNAHVRSKYTERHE